MKTLILLILATMFTVPAFAIDIDCKKTHETNTRYNPKANLPSTTLTKPKTSGAIAM